ncbi:cytokine receptor family member b4 isoform X2 [Colossoma macropomum]|uniref:cytokine receptor family member b4 isoform X2 n=1 Tax=Colossoma macropomum TaxID=42526 RepID=UPI001863A04B|nr:cytokine receptor family member b4 isoform X2 [Colossoma macropomum]
MILTLIVLMLYSCVSAEGQVPSPENVRIVSQNMGLVLEWDPPQNSTGKDFTYRAEYKGWSSFVSVCLNESSRRCDFTSVISVFGTYKFRVRAELEGKSSDWVKTDTVALDEITLISAPNVMLESTRGGVEVDITDPVLRKGDLKSLYHLISYHIHYWIEGEAKKEELKTEQSRVTLPDLTPRVRYCVQVKIAVSGNKTSLPGNATCILNTESEVQPWLIVGVLLASFGVVLVSVVLIFFAVWYTYRGIRFLCPQAKLPEHFKQYLSERPKSSEFLAMQNSLQPEERYHEVSIIPCLEHPTASQDLQKTQGPKCTKLYANISSKPEEALNQEKKLCDHKQRMDNEHTERNAALSGCHDGETELLLR